MNVFSFLPKPDLFQTLALRRAVFICRQAYDKPNRHSGNDQWFSHQNQIAIAGSNDIGDWIDNLNPGFEDYAGLKDCRAGFVHSAKAVAEIEIERLHLENVTKTIHIFGHSKGAAAAILLAYKLEAMGFKTKTIVLACPRITFRKPDIKLDITEFHAFGDIVPRLPIYIPWFRPWGRLGRYVRCCSPITGWALLYEILYLVFLLFLSRVKAAKRFAKWHLLDHYEKGAK